MGGGGARYFVTFINNFSGEVWLYVLKYKVKSFKKVQGVQGCRNPSVVHTRKPMSNKGVDLHYVWSVEREVEGGLA